MNQTEDDEFEGSDIPCARCQGQQSTANGENEKTEVIQAHPTEHIGDAAKGHQQRGGHDHITKQKPEKIAGFARGQWVNSNPFEDSGKRDEHNAGVNGCH